MGGRGKYRGEPLTTRGTPDLTLWVKEPNSRAAPQYAAVLTHPWGFPYNPEFGELRQPLSASGSWHVAKDGRVSLRACLRISRFVD